MGRFANLKQMADEYAKKIMGSNCYIVLVYLISIIFLIVFTYSFYLRAELNKFNTGIRKMKSAKEEHDLNVDMPSITALTNSDYTAKTPEDGLPYGLIDYYVMGSFNSCCTGDVINGYVSLEALKQVIGYGVRLLDFEIYFKDGKVVVAAGRNNIYMKDTYNELEINSVLEAVRRYALRGTAGNFNMSDPLILNFRIITENKNVYHVLEKAIMKNFSDYLADRKFGKEGRRQNTDIFTTNFKNIRGKVIILVDDPTENYRDVPDFYELVNGTTKRYVRKYTDYQMKNEKSNETYISETKNNFVISTPDVMEQRNSSYQVHHNLGAQGVLMNFGGGYNDENLKGYIRKFSMSQKAFLLKPKHLQRSRGAIDVPVQQDPELSFAMQQAETTIQGTDMNIQFRGSSGESINL